MRLCAIFWPSGAVLIGSVSTKRGKARKFAARATGMPWHLLRPQGWRCRSLVAPRPMLGPSIDVAAPALATEGQGA